MHFAAYITQRTHQRSRAMTLGAESDWLQVSSTLACSLQLSSNMNDYQPVFFFSLSFQNIVSLAFVAIKSALNEAVTSQLS